MNAGRGDLPRLIDDLASGRLTGAPPGDYLLLLQEAVTGVGIDANAVANARGLHALVVPVYEIDGRLRGNVILSTQPLRHTRALPLPRERQPRMGAVATVTVAGTELFVVSTHFENRVSWRRGGFFSDAARGRQAQALIGALPDGPGIVGGDINTWLGPRERAWRLLARRFTDTPELRTPTLRDRLILDHLFFDLPDGWSVSTRVLEQRYGSDHHPVLGVIRFD
jgi:endonuclease/exonuclease/phosphatase family metal-dependent hydrolase